MRTDFSKYKFRCHALGNIMSGITVGLTHKQEELFNDYHFRMTHPDAKPLTINQQKTYGELLAKKNSKPTLSKGAKSYLQLLHKEVIFNRSKNIQSKFMDKGLQVEEKAITLYSELTGQLFIKNKERRENKYWTGEADNVQGKIRDIKSSWDYTTFPMHEDDLPTQMYDWQMQAYMDLWGMDTAEVIYCLVDTPEMIIEDEKRRMSWKTGMIEVPEDLEQEIERSLTYSDIPKELRVKVFHVKRDPEKLKLMRSQVLQARKYLNSLSIKLADQVQRMSPAEV